MFSREETAMKSASYIFFLFLFALSETKTTEEVGRTLLLKNVESYGSDVDWAIIGAGPAGIVAVGLLCDLGVPAERIMWIDPAFNVGRLGEYYSQVPGNTQTYMYINFLKACKTFQKVSSPAIDALYTLSPEGYEKLQVIVDPLQDITTYLRSQVHSIQGMMDALFFEKGVWHVGAQGKTISTKHVILAVGSHPKTLDYSVKDVIPLDYALDKNTLHSLVNKEDSIAVVGSAHSAILILKFLSETSVKRIISLYTNPIVYAVDMGTWVLNNAHGLKGIAAQWAREVLEKNPPLNLMRVKNTPEARAEYLPLCNKIIYAIGYERNELPDMQINNALSDIMFDSETGVIGPRIFGIGIAFPGTHTDPLGNKEQLIGLNSFMKYAQKVMPSWVSGEARERLLERFRVLAAFEELFRIELL